MRDSSPTIHLLPPQVANQIAAGEVVERPAAVVKELVENAIDAGATKVLVQVEGAGKRRIVVEDNGCGMSAADAELALQRHATSKISSVADLHTIASHGFRGEALPSIASVSRFRMQTALAGSGEGVEVRVDGGAASQVRPAAPRIGTRIEVLDLFLNTPARLNFMRTDKTEEAAIVEQFRALALANPSLAMRLELDGRKRFDFSAEDARSRTEAILGRDFADNSLEIALQHEGIEITAHLGLPTFHHRDSSKMLFLINGRVIRDKQLIAAMRAGYRDVMFHDRYPIGVVRLEMDPADVDVNVHPSKREVRFKSPQRVRAGIVATIRAAIEQMGQQVASTTTEQALHAMQSMQQGGGDAGVSETASGGAGMPRFSSGDFRAAPTYAAAPAVSTRSRVAVPDDLQRMLFSGAATPTDDRSEAAHEGAGSYRTAAPLRLGRPLAQIHGCYILAQRDDGVVLVDQHAAHERITYEKLKQQLATASLKAQMLLTPEPLALQGEAAAWLHEHGDELLPFGVALEAVGDELFHIRSVPAMLSAEPLVGLVEELIDACRLVGGASEAGSSGQARVLERWLGNRACKGSIKSGRKLSVVEQESLLREMEQTPNIAQCNHGRPTYVTLSLNDLDRLFGRKD